MHENQRSADTKLPSDRSFGMVLACFFVLIGVTPALVRHQPIRLWALAVAAAAAVLAPNCLVGLFINADKAFRKHGWAAQVTQAMKRLAKDCGLTHLIIPLRLTTRYEHQNAKMPYEEFALLKRDDGEYRDHWLRMHTRLGAEVIGISAVSHQHAMHPEDLDEQVHCGKKEQTGEYLIRWNDEYYNIFVDVEREYAIMNQGCVWVRHAL
jgi:hypothetical protein